VQIVVNTRLLLKNKLEGIGWFSYQTLKRITTAHKEHQFIFLFDRPYNEEFIFSENITPVILSPQARHPFLYYLWFQHSVKGLLSRMKPSLFLSPDGFLSLGANCNQLPVIHDLNFIDHPQDLKWLTAKYYNYYFPRFANEATRIATVSEFSKTQIIKHYRISEDKIDVVYNGINSFFKPLNHDQKITARKKFTGGKNYFVSVGSLHPRKNIVRLIKGFSLFKKETSSDMKLLLAGPHFWGLSDIYKVIEACEMRDEVLFTGRLENEDLALALGAATALTFVPYYEGFGIPIIEAMEAGVPIITSNVTSLPEVAGDAAMLVDPLEETEIKSAMIRLYRDEQFKKELIEKGTIRKLEFSWDNSAKLLWNSIEKAAK
jgi:glycosyltransferase involved in cell wall biosynthesis